MDYLQLPRRQKDPPKRPQRLWISFAACLISVLTGVGTAFLVERPAFSIGGDTTSVTVAPLTQALLHRAASEATLTVSLQPTATTAHSQLALAQPSVQASPIASSPSPLPSATAAPTATELAPTDVARSAAAELQRVATATA